MPIENKYQKIIYISGTLIIVWCFWVLLLNSLLKNQIVQPHQFGHLPMAADSAFCFILSATILIFLFAGDNNKKSRRFLPRFLSVAVSAAGIWAIVQSLYRFLLIPPGFINALNFEMSPLTAFCFILLGLALYNIQNRRAKLLVQGLLHFITLIAFIVLLGHLFHVPGLYNFSLFPAMAVYSALSFLILSVAASFLNPEVGITGIFTGQQIGHLMARKLFFIILVATLCAGYLRLLAHKHRLLEVEMGTALLILMFCLISLASIWHTTKKLNRYEEKDKLAQENLAIVLDSAPYSIIKTNGEGKIVLINRQAERLFGYSRKELVGEMLTLLIPERFHDLYRINQKLVQESGEVSTFGLNEDLYAVGKAGREFPVEVIVCPIVLHDRRATLVTLIDISKRRHDEKIITDQLLQLQSKNQELEQFNYISSHDLQEPLRTILNYVQMLEEDYPDLDPEVKMHHKSMQEAVLRMSMVVRSLLEFGRLGSNRKLVCTNINHILDDVTADLQSLIENNDARVVVECELPDILVYETELRQLFQNLIANAIKFRKEEVSPVVTICCETKPGYYEFSVSDNGIGIAPQHFDKVFNIFQRLNKADDYEGHGIGLANCKKIAEMHGGKIWVESEPGVGSTFKFTIINFKP